MNPEWKLASLIRQGPSTELSMCRLIRWLRNKGEIDQWSMIDPELEVARYLEVKGGRGIKTIVHMVDHGAFQRQKWFGGNRQREPPEWGPIKA